MIKQIKIRFCPDKDSSLQGKIKHCTLHHHLFLGGINLEYNKNTKETKAWKKKTKKKGKTRSNMEKMHKQHAAQGNQTINRKAVLKDIL